MRLRLQHPKRPKLQAILHKEFQNFIGTHQRSLFDMRDEIFKKTIHSFFAREIFPIAEKWITDITNVAVMEVNGPMEVKVQEDRSFTEGSILKVRDLLKKSEDINCIIALDKMTAKLDLFVNKFLFNIDMFLPLWWMGVKESWHKEFISSYLEAIDTEINGRSGVAAGIFNFTNKEIPPEIYMVLSKGKNYIPHIKESSRTALERFECELINQATWYSKNIERRKIYNDHAGMNTREILKDLIYYSKTDKDKTFYSVLLQNLACGLSRVSQNAQNTRVRFDFDSVSKLSESIVIEGCVWNHVDKDGGLLLIEEKIIQMKESELMQSMDACIIENKSSDQILDELAEADKTLRSNFNPIQKRYISKFRSLRRESVEMSFLKI